MLFDSMEACAMDVGSEFSISVKKAVEVDKYCMELSEFFDQVKILWTLLTIIDEKKGIV